MPRSLLVRFKIVLANKARWGHDPGLRRRVCSLFAGRTQRGDNLRRSVGRFFILERLTSCSSGDSV